MRRIRIDRIVLEGGANVDPARLRRCLAEALSGAFGEDSRKPAFPNREEAIARAIAIKVKEAVRSG
ncbi:MAG: hypothetical protein KF784_00445 [Fimbriimonadaceae bacterium]|nr:hypothetical protein [Fimbriimonadaceae bacterium]